MAAYSSIMRWRNGLIVFVECVMGLLLLNVEATCLNSQHRKQTLNAPISSNRATLYRSASGLVLWPVKEVLQSFSAGFSMSG